eukprot:1195994-Prorocentrum_minimum.AAC.3
MSRPTPGSLPASLRENLYADPAGRRRAARAHSADRPLASRTRGADTPVGVESPPPAASLPRSLVLCVMLRATMRTLRATMRMLRATTKSLVLFVLVSGLVTRPSRRRLTDVSAGVWAGWFSFGGRLRCEGGGADVHGEGSS